MGRFKMLKDARCRTCGHAERPHKAGGDCDRCYYRKYRRKVRKQAKKARPAKA